MPHVLLVDDEVHYAEQLRVVLPETFRVSYLSAPHKLLDLDSPFDFSGVDLLLVDLRMPSMDGMTFLARLRRLHSKLPPQAIVTQVGSSESRIEAYKTRIFDFIDKSVTAEELLVRLENVLYLRQQETTQISFGRLRYDPELLYFLHGDHPLDLTKKEKMILFHLAQTADGSMERKKLINKIWPNNPVVAQTLNTHIFNLNLKISQLGYQVSVTSSGLVQISDLSTMAQSH